MLHKHTSGTKKISNGTVTHLQCGAEMDLATSGFGPKKVIFRLYGIKAHVAVNENVNMKSFRVKNNTIWWGENI